MKHLLLFDVDGTLIDSQHMIVDAMAAAFAAHGVPPPPRVAVLEIVGLSLDRAVAHLLGDAEVSVSAVCGSYKTAFADLRAGGGRHEPLYPGARAALDAFAARDDVILGLATGKSRRGVANVLDLHRLHGRFVTIQTADDHPSKPHPAMIRAALAETGIAPGRAMMLGDTNWDIEMGVAAGIVAVGVAWGYQTKLALAAAGAAAILADFAELEPTFDRIFAVSRGA
ncbi:HAD-IA family hydrolase [Siculibacillus lacustris]|uniref:HAD-IA family hydrolase n=1 Tax=Siculibacillus lacustris TaxID=1549641 RepID=UPI001D18FAF3|nr:HAD-IA family hydrolase [Siculibacillus lacustris]